MIYGELYPIVSQTSFLIYGAATTGAFTYFNLKKRGFQILGFLDQRAYELDRYYGLPVWDIEQAAQLVPCQDIVVIIAVKNVFEHETIAKKLWRSGFQRLIYRPVRFLQGKAASSDALLNDVYDQLTCKSIDHIQQDEFFEVPLIQGEEEIPIKDHAILCDDGEFVTAKIPYTYVFTDPYVNHGIFENVPCLALLPHIGLFDLFNGRWNPDYQEYIKFCRTAAEQSGEIVMSQSWENSVYQNRMDVFNHMQDCWEHDPGFFIRNAVTAQYNPNGYFNIRSGKHRIAYLLVKGCYYLPLRIRSNEYGYWKNEDQAKKILAFLQDNQWDTLPLVLENPYFSSYPSESSVFYLQLLKILLTEIFRKNYYLKKDFDLQGKKILFQQTPMVLYARIFHLLGFEIYICENDHQKMQLNQLVLSAIPYVTSSLPDITYDIAVLQHSDRAIKADITVSISHRKQEKRAVDVCGMSAGKWLYAYLDGVIEKN